MEEAAEWVKAKIQAAEQQGHLLPKAEELIKLWVEGAETLARIVQALTQPAEQYDQQLQQSFVRDVDSIVHKLNSTFQQDLKDELEAVNFYLV